MALSRVAGALVWMCVLLALAMPAVAQVDLEPYLKEDRYERIRISPTGEYFAVTVPLEDRTVLAVMRRSDKTITAKASGAAHSGVLDFWWVNDTRVVVAMTRKFGSQDKPMATGELHAVDADGGRGMLLGGPNGAHDDIFVGNVAMGGEPALHLIDTLRDDDRNVLVAAWPLSSDPVTRVEKLDVYNRRRSTVAVAPVRNARFTVDASGEVRFARGYGADGSSKLYYRDARGSDWRLVNDQDATGLVVSALGFSADGRTAYLQTEVAGGPDAIQTWDPATGKRTDLLRDAVVDPWAIIDTADGGAPAGAWFMSDRIRSRFFDEASPTAKQYRMLEKAFAGHAVAVTSTTKDGKVALVHAWSDRNNGDFYLFDTTTRAANLLHSRREWIEPGDVPPTTQVALDARDGRKLHGCLTLPLAGGKGLPMVVMPHGGPFGVFDEWDFDDDSQVLAGAGYAVLRINYRGSGNYGRDHHQAGAKQWGRAMQDDVTDATRWAIAQGIADPARICIHGASYGGYAALMGPIREPGLYKCASGYVGVYDLRRVHREDSRLARSAASWTEDWLGARDTLDAVSPVNLADRVKVPVFLAAGGEDVRAPIVHSEDMEKALRKAGSPVETLYYPTEGHGFHTIAHRREYWRRLLAFLSQHIGGAKAK